MRGSTGKKCVCVRVFVGPCLQKPPTPRQHQPANQIRPPQKVRREVSEPHEAIRLRTQQLKNLHAATRLLKRALRFLSALRRLRGQEEALGLDAAALAAAGGGGIGSGGGGLADLRELAKAAQSLQVWVGMCFSCFMLMCMKYGVLIYVPGSVFDVTVSSLWNHAS